MRWVLATLITLAVSSPAAAQPPLDARASHALPGGPLVVFSDSELFVSRDDGATFVPMAAPVPHVRDVAIERDGTLVVLGGTDAGEETRLARVHADGSISPMRVSSWVSAIAVGGDVLAATMPYESAIGLARVGGELVPHPTPPSFGTAACAHAPGSDACAEARVLSTDASLFVDRDGTSHVVDVEVNTCGSSDILDWARVLLVEPSGAMRVRALFHPRPDASGALERVVAVPLGIAVYPTRWTAGPHGWAYALTEDGALAALGRSAAAPRVLPRAPGLPTPDALEGGEPLALPSNGALTVTQLGSVLVQLDGLRARVLADDIPADARVADVDARGRVLAVGPRALHRWSRRNGWRLLWSAP